MVEHVLRDCSKLATIWFSSLLGFRVYDARNIGWVEWIANLAKSLAKESFDLVLLFIWNIWKDRNELIWQGLSRHSIDIHYMSQAWVLEYKKVAWKTDKHNQQFGAVDRWKKPTLGRNKEKKGVGGGGGGGIGVVIRDEAGHFVAAMAMKWEEVAAPLVAELEAARAAVMLARELGTNQLELEGDAALVIAALQKDDDMYLLGAIIQETRYYLHSIP
ncbi:hypothetical protein D8674_035167 [Pyrus ussuriensis x Pyrus communis]|uniref:RNase H type-1 domain-containing protein n=1 Tax=Pyrus ussuriensis x Pyrus communis TaxID=2448454 RepID=A0A5N5GG93_9ROSA|nr:hypothetical protein D8674_035167 [Pyrus ussuriensis x Pyrus communis]